MIVELDVLEGKRRLGPERPEHFEVVVGKRPPTSRHGDHAMRTLVRLQSAKRDRGDTDRGGVRLGYAAVFQRGELERRRAIKTRRETFGRCDGSPPAAAHVL